MYFYLLKNLTLRLKAQLNTHLCFKKTTKKTTIESDM